MALIDMENVGLEISAENEKIEILKNINLSFEAGKMYAITGPNGSGKSSVAKVIMGISKPTGGKVFLNGQDISSVKISERAKMGIGYAFQHPARFKGLTVSDLLEIASRLNGKIDCQCLVDIGLCPDDYMKRPLDSNLSGGEIKRIEIASLLAQNPKVRIFDEPEAGIDLWSFERLVNVMNNSHNSDTTTVVISHQEKILKMVDEIVLITDGKVDMQGSRDDMYSKLIEGSRCECRTDCRKEGEIYANCPR